MAVSAIGRRPAKASYTVRLTVGPADLYELLRSNDSAEFDGLGDEAWSRAYVSAGVPALDIGVRAGDYQLLLFFGETDVLDTGVQFTQAVLDGLGE